MIIIFSITFSKITKKIPIIKKCTLVFVFLYGMSFINQNTPIALHVSGTECNFNYSQMIQNLLYK